MTANATPIRTAWISTITVILLHSVVLAGMGQWLWGREHYQFFPIVLLGSGALAWYRLQEAAWPTSPILSIRVILYASLSAIIFAVGALAGSNWLGTLSFVGLLWSAIWFFGGKGIAARLRGPVFLLLIAVPLPLNLDLALIIELQKIASTCASQLLDMRHVTHAISGVAIRTVDRDFMVEEACSGIHSLFSCVTVMIFWATCFRYGPLRFVLTVLQTIGWVLVGNILRVFLIIFAHARWDMDLETGTAHEVLGICTYLGALLMALSTDRLFQFIVPSHIHLFDKTDVVGGYGSGYVQDSATSLFKKLNRILDRNRVASRHGLLALIVVGALYVPFCGIGLASALRAKPSTYTPGEFSASLDSFVSEDMLPKRVGQWSLTDVKRVDRPMDDLLGANSVIWTYQGNGMEAQFSMDGLYREWHDLSFCYSALGWNMSDVQNIAVNEDDKNTTRLEMYRGTNENAISLFRCIDSNFDSVKPAPTRGSTVRNLLLRLKSGSLISDSSNSYEPPVIQFQLMISTDRELLEYERNLLRSLFADLGDHALTRLKGAK